MTIDNRDMGNCYEEFLIQIILLCERQLFATKIVKQHSENLIYVRNKSVRIPIVPP